MDRVVVGVRGRGWELFDLGNNGVRRDEYTDATVHYIKSMQAPEGNWLAFESRRPPMNTGPYQTAALAIYSLQTYGPPAEKADTDKVVARATAWLEAAKPATTPDRPFQLMGLPSGNPNSPSIAAAAKSL